MEKKKKKINQKPSRVFAFTGWVVPSMSMRVIWFCKDVRGHLALALGGRLLVCAEAEVGLPTWRS